MQDIDLNNLSSKDLLKLEYLKCISDPKYPIETFLETFDQTRGGFVPFKLFKRQADLINSYESERLNLVLKYRQAGISTISAAYSSVKLTFASIENPQKILIIANKLTTAIEFLKKIVEFIDQYPDRLHIHYEIDSNGRRNPFRKRSEKHVILHNKCEIKAVATSPDALRGYTPTLMILDEAAFIEGGEQLWSACLASLSTGGKATLISTPNGQDAIYYTSYDEAKKGKNNFVISHLKWWEDPRFNKELKMVKTDDIISWLYKPPSEKTEDVLPLSDVMISDYHLLKEQVEYYIEKGYKPISPWYEKMCQDMNGSRRMIFQELECQFNGSGDNVIATEVIEKQLLLNVKDPIYKDLAWNNDVWIWAEPIEGHRYILATDISRGDSEDFTAFTIIDYDDWEQVAEFEGKIPPDVAAELINIYGNKYNAFVTLDITGGMGVATARKLMYEYKYPKTKLHFDSISDDNLVYIPDDGTITPGINFASQNRRGLIVQSIEELFRSDFKIRSARAISQSRKFIYINGRPDHQKGAHDDILMCIGMGGYVANKSFKNLERASASTKEMLNSWQIYNQPNNIPTENTILSNYILEKRDGYKSDFIKNEQILKNTRDFSWVFGKLNKYKVKK